MRKQRVIEAWISKQAVITMEEMAEFIYPLETGGCLIGYWSKKYEEVVITDCIGPGPNAIHKCHTYKPDSEWQQNEIARIYKQSGRVKTYLGDWHVHPKGNTGLSWKDKRTLLKIALHEEARAPFPLMVIIAGPPWKVKIWKTIKLLKILLSVKAIECDIEVY